MLLVDTQMKTLRRPAALPDFLQTQEGHLSDIVDALRSDWLLKVCSAGQCCMLYAGPHNALSLPSHASQA